MTVAIIPGSVGQVTGQVLGETIVHVVPITL